MKRLQRLFTLGIFFLLIGCSKTHSDSAQNTSYEGRPTDDRDTQVLNTSGTVGGTEHKETDTPRKEETVDAGPQKPSVETTNCVLLDFETPKLSPEESIVADPFTDEQSGVTIIGLSENDLVPIVVQTELSDACGTGQWLATTSEDLYALTGNLSSRAGYPFQLTFSEPLSPPVRVAVDTWTGMGHHVHITLFDSVGNGIGETEKRAHPSLNPSCFVSDNVPPVFMTVGVSSDEEVFSMHIENPDGVLMIDNVALKSTSLHGDAACPWNEQGDVLDNTERCVFEEEQLPVYVCVDDPEGVAICEDCDVECMRQTLRRDRPIEPNSCIPSLKALVCGPDKGNSERCCYFADKEPYDDCID